MAFQSEIAGTQIDGARDYQEDAFLITHLSDSKGNPSALIIVADGMGGHAAGNVASNMAVQAFNKSITTNYPTEDVSGVLNESLSKANGAITETVKETPALDGMGCTMIGVIIEGTNLWWVSVGDSHLYLLRNRKLTKLNEDHSYGGFLDRMEAAGTPVEAEPGLSRNMLMSAVTGADIAEIECPPSPITLEHDDKLVICSDGMDTLSEGKIIQYSDWAENSKECAEALMDAVEDAAMPRQDNTTAVVVKITDDSISATTTQEEDDDDDKEDITTPGAAKGDKTAEMETSPEEAEDSEDIAEVAADAAEAVVEKAAETKEEIVDLTSDEASMDVDVTEAISEDKETSEKSKTGLIVGIAASVLITLVVGGYFIFGITSSDKTPPEEIISEDEILDEAIADDKPSTTPEIAESTDEEKIVETTTTDPAPETDDVIAEIQPTPEPETEPVPAPKLPSKKEFQDDLKDGGKSPIMVVIPAGSFVMGGSSSSRFTDERPKHTVNVKSIAVSKFEVTFVEYDKFANATNRKPPNDLYMDRETHPVIFLKWDDAYYYTKWLSEQTGKKYRLLSESEWEYAASTGTKSPFWWGFNEEAGKAHCFSCKTGLDPRKPSKVGGFEANKFGLHDTAGNVAEWVKDCWHENYKGAPSDSEVWEGGDYAYRAVRGGAYISPQQSIRSAKRDKLKSDSGYDHVGIRIARELD